MPASFLSVCCARLPEQTFPTRLCSTILLANVPFTTVRHPTHARPSTAHNVCRYRRPLRLSTTVQAWLPRTSPSTVFLSLEYIPMRREHAFFATLHLLTRAP